jgi:ABC-type amino acid transport system permease subunit
MEFYTAIAVIYFMIIFPLSVYARRAERRRLRRTGN